MKAVSAVVINHNGDQQIMCGLQDLVDIQSSLHELVVVNNGLQSTFETRAVRELSSILNFYWRVCRPLVAGGSAPCERHDQGHGSAGKVCQ